MATGRIWRACATALMCLGLSVLFTVLGFGAAIFTRSLCIELGFRWGFLADMGGIGVFFMVFVLGGATLGVIAGMKLRCPQHKEN